MAYANGFVIRRRNRELALYNILGMQKSNIAAVLGFEMLFLCLACVAAGLALGALFSKLMLLVLLRLMRFEVVMGFSFSIPAAWQTAAAMAVLFFSACTCSTCGRCGGPTPSTCSTRTGWCEREPKSRWLLALFGLVTLGAGYYLAAATTDITMVILLFFCGGGAGHCGHPLPVWRGQRGGAQGAAQKQAVLLPAAALYRGVRHDLPHEPERPRPGQHLHPGHHRAGQCGDDGLPVYGHREHRGYHVPPTPSASTPFAATRPTGTQTFPSGTARMRQVAADYGVADDEFASFALLVVDTHYADGAFTADVPANQYAADAWNVRIMHAGDYARLTGQTAALQPGQVLANGLPEGVAEFTGGRRGHDGGGGVRAFPGAETARWKAPTRSAWWSPTRIPWPTW